MNRATRTYNPEKLEASIRVVCTPTQKRQWTIFAHGELSDIVRDALDRAYKKKARVEPRTSS